jgi:hypothetical protein
MTAGILLTNIKKICNFKYTVKISGILSCNIKKKYYIANKPVKITVVTKNHGKLFFRHRNVEDM